MRVLPLHPEVVAYLQAHQLVKKFEKQLGFFVKDRTHPSLHVELLEPHHLKIFSFRIDRKYRAIFIFTTSDTIEMLDVNNHYR